MSIVSFICFTHIFIVFIVLLSVWTLTILTSAFVAEFVTTSACHVITAIVLLNPVFASCASLCTYTFSPNFKLAVFLKFCVVDLFRSCAGWVFSAGLADVILHIALEAPWKATGRAIVLSDLFGISTWKEVIASGAWALKVFSRVAIPDHFPLKFLQSCHFSRIQKLSEVCLYWNWLLTVRDGAFDR